MGATERMRIGTTSRRLFLTGAAAAALAACRGPAAEPETDAVSDDPDAGTLGWAVAGAWRADGRPRDAARHPIETLDFFEIEPGQTVVEMWPGAGWWTEILAPYLAQGGGRLYAATFQVERDQADQQPGSSGLAAAQIVARYQERFGGSRRLYGEVELTEFGPSSGPVAPADSADLVLFMNNLHNWMAAGLAEKAFGDAYAALKPGGVLGVVQNRADVGEIQDPAATDGYVQESFVKQLAAEAGFAFVAASEVNANPRDTKDHPFGVWTLPPDNLTAPRGEAPNPAFDRAPYQVIGEADRMTLKFRKPTA